MAFSNAEKSRPDGFLDRIAAELLMQFFKSVFQLVDFIIRQRPVAGVAGKPKLNVTHLLRGHDVTDRGYRRLVGACWRWHIVRPGVRHGKQSRGQKRCEDQFHRLLLWRGANRTSGTLVCRW